MVNTTHIRLDQELKKEIDELLPKITSQIYEEGDKELINQISKKGLSYSKALKFLVKWYREK